VTKKIPNPYSPTLFQGRVLGVLLLLRRQGTGDGGGAGAHRRGGRDLRRPLAPPRPLLAHEGTQGTTMLLILYR